MNKSPLQTAHQVCLACVGSSQKELSECENAPNTKHECVIHPFRFGRNTKGYRMKLSVFKNYCKCCMDSLQLKECTSLECILYNYWRFGKNPNKAGKINVGSYQKKLVETP